MAKTEIKVELMARKMPTFGHSETDEAVKEWFLRKGINPNDVLGYTVIKSPHESVIEIRMVLDDVKPEEPGSR